VADDDDDELYAMLGHGMVQRHWDHVSKVVKKIASHPERYVGLSVMLPTSLDDTHDIFNEWYQSLKASNVGLVGPAKTVKDLISSETPCVLTGEFVSEVLGGSIALDALKDKFVLNLLPEAMTASAAMFAKGDA
jgi:hypothetical protein